MILPLPPAPTPPPIVELFTSEGCSSCPPAEALLARYAREGRITLLAHHVDYWDRLGWRDPFSSKLATERQNGYASRFGLEQIYTPQAIVNGMAQFVGSDEHALRAALARAPKMRGMEVRIEAGAGRWTVAAPKTSGADVVLATVLAPKTTRVERGENGGRTLTHLGIVRSFRLLGPAGASYAVAAPEVGGTLVAFVQRRGYREILGAATATP